MPYISHRRIGTSHRKENESRRNSKWQRYYQDKRWKKLREWFMSTHSICHDCALNGRSVPATECHHVIPFGTGDTDEDKFALLLDPDNLIALCSECHDKRHNILNHSK